MILRTLLALIALGTSLPVFAENNALLVVKGEIIQVGSVGNFKEFLIQKSEVIAFTASLDKQRVNSFVKSGFSVALNTTVNPIQVTSCKEAIVVLGVGEGNVIPTLHEIYMSPTIVNFTCINN